MNGLILVSFMLFTKGRMKTGLFVFVLAVNFNTDALNYAVCFCVFYLGKSLERGVYCKS